MPIERVTFNAITKDAVHDRDAQPAPDRRGAGRRLSGPPRARLPRRLHALAGAVAQAAGRPLGRPRAVGRAAPRLRPRARDRDLRAARILVARRDPGDRRTAPSFEARLVGADGKQDHAPRRRQRRGGARPSSATSNSRPSRSPPSRRSPPSATRSRPSPPRRCSRRPRASSASRRPTPCGSPSASTRASRSAARRSASSPICGPTASTWRPRRSPARAASSARNTASATARRAAHATRPRRRTRRRRTRPCARPTWAACPRPCARTLDADQARLYELIWTRTVASQMESAELERTTVDIDAAVGPRKHRAARHRPGREVRRLPRRSTRRASDDEATTRTSSRLPPMKAGDAPGARAHRRDPALHRAAAALLRGEPRQAHGGARHRPALDLCGDARGAARPRIRAGSTRSGSCPRTRAGSSSAFLESFFRRYVEYDFTADLEEQLDRVSNGEIDWKQVLRDFWRDFSAAIDGTKELRITRGARRAERAARRRTSSPPRPTAATRAPARPAAPASCR